MHVKEVMTSKPLACHPETNLAAAAKLMWDGDCGTIPLTDSSGKVVGMLTDRDICIAVATRNRAASQIRAQEVMSGKVVACKADDDLRSALGSMKEHRVRRLPVVDAEGKLVGVISLNDVVLATGVRSKELTPEDVLSTFRAICAHRPALATPTA